MSWLIDLLEALGVDLASNESLTFPVVMCAWEASPSLKPRQGVLLSPRGAGVCTELTRTVIHLGGYFFV